MENIQPKLIIRKRPIFTVLALVLAVMEVALSIALYSSGYGAGFEGFGAMLMGSVIALFGVVPVLVLLLVATIRKETKAPLKWIAFSISVFGLLLAISR